MSSLFNPKSPKPPPTPKPVRMPVETDPDVLAAGQRTRMAALGRERQGRLSTILTDQTMRTTGSSGQKLGA